MARGGNSWLVYVVFVLIFGVGLWVILRLGRNLEPAPNVAGRWVVEDGPTVVVEQSGLYLQVTPDQQPPRAARLARQPDGAFWLHTRDGGLYAIEFSADRQQATVFQTTHPSVRTTLRRSKPE